MEGHLQILDMPTLRLKYIVFFDLWCGICLLGVKMHVWSVLLIHVLLSPVSFTNKKINSNAVTLEYMNSFSQLIIHNEINHYSHLHCLITWNPFSIYTIKHTTSYDFSDMYTYKLLTTTSAMCPYNYKYAFHILCHHNAFKIRSVSLLAFGRLLHKVT